MTRGRNGVDLRTTPTDGMTLVELVLVVAVLGILAAVVVASFAGAGSAATETACKAQVKSLRTAVEQYAAHPDNFHGYPVSALPGLAGASETLGKLDPQFLSDESTIVISDGASFFRVGTLAPDSGASFGIEVSATTDPDVAPKIAGFYRDGPSLSEC